MIPNVTTMAAPVGTSKLMETNIPAKLPKIPKDQPNISRPRIESQKNSAATIGIIK